MKIFFEMISASILCVCWYLMSYYGAFYVCLADDVEFKYGKKRMKKLRKEPKGFWKKFLFLDIRKEVISWHYAMFWLNLVFSNIALIALNVYIACNNEIIRISFIIAGGFSILTTAIIAFVRWPLYIGNKVRSRKRYRKK